MKFYEVLVASQQFHGDTPLTYSFHSSLLPGQIVIIPLQRIKVIGVIRSEVKQPPFKTKDIIDTIALNKLPSQLLDLFQWLKLYYPAPLGQLMTLFLPSTLLQKSRSVKVMETEVRAHTTTLPTLTNEQRKVIRDILKSNARMHILHGETGSGKTRVYIELIKNSFANNQSALLLTPEIGLTPQLTQMIENAFPGQSIVLHSGLTPHQRRNRWLSIINQTKPQVVIGPRSAIFAPLHTVGFIIIDEAHDTAYKQEQSPYYQTSRVAAKLGELHNAKVILGTATPLIADYYTFKQKGLPIHRMMQLAHQTSFQSMTEIVSLKDRVNFTKSDWLSNQLITAVQAALLHGTQSLLFLNRRGTARTILCRKCGWRALCPQCDITLTYHADHHRMQCHSCGYKHKALSACPECYNTDITFKNIGTKAVVSELSRIFPEANIIRLDGDNRKEETLEHRFHEIKTGKIDIIVGTQVISKGLDLPKLGLVAVVLADTGLNFPDYTAEERTYQLLTQVIGRVDRGHRQTRVVVQTFNPENSTINFSLSKDYYGFYKQQLSERKSFGFPPFKYILKLRIERATSKAAEKTSVNLGEKLQKSYPKIIISDPVPSYNEKIQNKYRWQIILRSNNRSDLVEVIEHLPAYVHYDIDPSNLL